MSGQAGKQGFVVVEETCSGHALCWMEASALFPADEQGYNALRGKGPVPVSVELAGAASRGADVCPERAIIYHPGDPNDPRSQTGPPLNGNNRDERGHG
jgi:ferredoxin